MADERSDPGDESLPDFEQEGSELAPLITALRSLGASETSIPEPPELDALLRARP